MNRTIFWVIGALALIALGSWWGLHSPARRVPRYRTAAVERGAIETTVSVSGTIRPVEQVEVVAQVSGTVQRLGADFNARVRAGQVLCQLEPSAFHLRVAIAEAAVARAAAALSDGERALGRARERHSSAAAPDSELESAEAGLEQRQADVQSAEVALEATHADLEHATIRSPIDGVVIARHLERGQAVAAGPQAPRLFVIASDLARVQVEARVAEADIGRLRVGLPVSFTVDAFPDLAFRAAVSQLRLEPVVERDAVTYAIVMDADNPDGKLRPGMTAKVSVGVARHDDVIKIPNAALRFQPATVYVLRDGRPLPVPVVPGLTDGAMTEVRAADLGPNDRVIVGLEIAAGAPSRRTRPGSGPQLGAPPGAR